MQFAAIDYGTEKEVAQWRVVGGITKDRLVVSLLKDCAIDLAVVGRRDDEVVPSNVGSGPGARRPLDLFFRMELLHTRDRLGSNDVDVGSAGQQTLDLFQADRACSDYQAPLAFQLEEEREEARAGGASLLNMLTTGWSRIPHDWLEHRAS